MPPVSDVILEAIQEIIEAWKDEKYKTVEYKTLLLLKRKKTLNGLQLTAPLQRVLLQAYLKLDKFDAVLEWASKEDITSDVNDLILYAQYRQEDYATVVRKSQEQLKNDDNNDNNELLDHLIAQSQFHLNKGNETLQAYGRMADEQADDDEDEAKMELLTNAMATIVSMASTPYVSLKQHDDSVISSLAEQANALLEENDTNDEYADLAVNLGTLQFLTDPTVVEENWLEVAQDLTEDSNNDLALNTALQWSRHVWYKDLEEVKYSKSSNTASLSVAQSITNFNQALLEENLAKVPPKPHPKWNSLQIQLYWYNRAILQFKAKKWVECQESCQSLRKTLQSNSSTNSGGGKKKKKNKTDNSDGADASKSLTNTSAADLWWESRVDVLLAHVLLAQSKQKDALAKLNDRLESVEKCASSSFTIDHAVTHVALHRYRIQQSGNTKKADYQKGLLKVLQELPKSIRALPGAYYTLGDLEAMVDSMNDSSSTTNGKSKGPKTPREEANVLFEQGTYEEACKLYKESLPSEASSDEAIADSQLKYVQALAMTGQTEASHALWESLENSVEESTSTSLPDGSALEGKALPRSSGGAARSSLNRNLVADGADLDDDEEGTPSRDKILRYRARKREAYLKELEAKGQYNPDRPVKPNPERWIPKYERSRSRNKGRSGNNRSAQGGVSERDAQRLDAAARKAGKVPASSGPSTANLKVSSGGRAGRRR